MRIHSPTPLFSGDFRDQLRAESPLPSAIKETDEVIQVGAGTHSALSHY